MTTATLNNEATELYNHYSQEGLTWKHSAAELGITDTKVIDAAKRLYSDWYGRVVSRRILKPTTIVKPVRVMKKKPVRAKAFGYSVTAVLRWMGANGWNDRFEDAMIAICTISDNYNISDVTIRLQLKAGLEGKRGAVAPLTEAQGRALERAAL
jgi:hypothetical protein